jgi:hypothetical protein
MAAVVIDSALPRRRPAAARAGPATCRRGLSRNSPRGRADVPADSNEDGLIFEIEDGEDEEKGN